MGCLLQVGKTPCGIFWHKSGGGSYVVVCGVDIVGFFLQCLGGLFEWMGWMFLDCVLLSFVFNLFPLIW